jgi:type 1 glutamine amidotransferase
MRCLVVWASAAVCLTVLAFLGHGAALAQKVNPVEAIEKALPQKAPAVPRQPRKILIFSKTAGFRHQSIAVGAKAIAMMGEKTGAYTTLHTEDDSFFEPEKLKNFDAVLMLNTTGEVFKSKSDPNREEMLKKSLKEFVSGGKGLIGIHAATDTYHDWKDYNTMMGGAFLKHPWTANSKVSIKNLEPNNPLNAVFDGKGFDITDEIYIFRPGTALGTERKFLLALDESKMDVSKGQREDKFYAISWLATYGKGRTFYCSLGHNDHIYWNPAILKHYLAGIQYALGDLDADATPSQKK